MEMIDKAGTLSGNIKKIAKEIKKDHQLSIELWDSQKYYPRLLSVLILDRKELTIEKIEAMSMDVLVNDQKEQNHIGDWLLANQLSKSKGLKTMLEGFEDHSSVFLRRLYWYYQARLRWTGKTNYSNTAEIVDSIDVKLEFEDPEVQMAMNFCAGWIGVFDDTYTDQIIKIGEKTGLYKDDKVPKGCAPMYLPDFIEYEKKRFEK